MQNISCGADKKLAQMKDYNFEFSKLGTPRNVCN